MMYNVSPATQRLHGMLKYYNQQFSSETVNFLRTKTCA